MTKRREKKLLDRVRDVVRTKHHPIRTEEAYVNWIKCFILLPKSLRTSAKALKCKLAE
jgi:hypothetical protein